MGKLQLCYEHYSSVEGLMKLYVGSRLFFFLIVLFGLRKNFETEHPAAVTTQQLLKFSQIEKSK